MKFIFTSEAVTEGHPDKVADRIADSILDEILKQDPMARVACECVTAPELVFIFGEITTNAHVDYEKIARDTVKEIGYTKKEYGFDYKNMKVVVKMGEQSPNIAQGVDTGGAGDQGIMFGYATSETDDFMPLPIHLAQALAKRLTEVRKNGTIPYLRPDGKTQVSIEYEGRKPLRCSTVLISAQTDPNVSLERIKKDLKKYVIRAVIPEYLLKDSTRILVNPTGKFIVGGPAGDTGLTGRKIIVDTYGGVAHHGGGAFSGKDPTKVDRSATYMARYIAKNIVASGIALRCEIQLSYGIGIAEPISIYVDTFGTGKLTAKRIVSIIKKEFDLTPTGIINKLCLRNPIYKNVSVYGHFGRLDLDLPWERLDKVDDLKKYIQ